MKNIDYWESTGDTGNTQIVIDIEHLTESEKELLEDGLQRLLIKFRECNTLEDFQQMLKLFKENP